MKFALITVTYPKDGDYYGGGFIHQRVLQYKKRGFECKVYVINNNLCSNAYDYEGVSVHEGNFQYINGCLNNYKYDRILIHFIQKQLIEMVKCLDYKVPIVIWIHGVEVLGWYRRLFKYSAKEYLTVNFLKYVIKNYIKRYRLKRFIKENKDVKFVFVSKWMKKITEADLGVNISNYAIIPNVVNTELFNFEDKNFESRKKILVIRNFSSMKYAVDIIVKAIEKLVRKEYFFDLNITIYGQGKYFYSLTDRLKKYNNIRIYNTFLPQVEIAKIHKGYGIFLCPTRQDAQGVSMCEAMCSGLIPITSKNTAIPEFVDMNAGYLTNNSTSAIVNAIEELYYNKELFINKSKHSSGLAREICNPEKVIKKELKYIIDCFTDN